MWPVDDTVSAVDTTSNVMGAAEFSCGANPPVHVIDAAVPAGIESATASGITTTVPATVEVTATSVTPLPPHVVELDQIAADAVIVMDAVWTALLTGVPDAVPANAPPAFVVMVQSFVGLVPPSEVPRILRVSPLA